MRDAPASTGDGCSTRNLRRPSKGGLAAGLAQVTLGEIQSAIALPAIFGWTKRRKYWVGSLLLGGVGAVFLSSPLEPLRGCRARQRTLS